MEMWKIIEARMNQLEINQEQLSKRMKVHSGVVSDFKLGRIKKPSFELMCKFADALDVSLDSFRARKEEK